MKKEKTEAQDLRLLSLYTYNPTTFWKINLHIWLVQNHDDLTPNKFLPLNFLENRSFIFYFVAWQRNHDQISKLIIFLLISPGTQHPLSPLHPHPPPTLHPFEFKVEPTRANRPAVALHVVLRRKEREHTWKKLTLFDVVLLCSTPCLPQSFLVKRG